MGLVLILEVVVAFGLLIFVHELGHFLTAKWFRVRVEAFSLGFGPALKRKWGETEYRLGIVPLGGYVKMAGEQREEGREPGPDEFFGKPVWQRVIVLLSGAFMNLVLGVVTFCLAYGIGVPAIPAVVGDLMPGKPAWRAGLRPGDRIVELNGKSDFIEFEDVMMASALAGANARADLTVQRGGERLHFTLKPEYDAERGFKVLGIMPPDSLEVGGFERFYRGGPPAWPLRVLGIGPSGICPAEESGLKAGDRIAAVWREGRRTPLASTTEMHRAVMDSRGKDLRFEVMREEEARQVTISPAPLGSWLMGFSFHSARLAAVRPDSPPAKAGLEAGDRIAAVNGAPVACYSEFAAAVAKAPGDVSLTIEREGARLEKPVAMPARSLDLLDLDFAGGNVVDTVTPGFGMEELGVKPGDRILSVKVSETAADASVTKAANPVRTLDDIRAAVARSEDGTVEILVRQGDKESWLEVPLRREWVLGLVFRPLQELRRHANVFAAARAGFDRTGKWIVNFYLTLRGFFVGQVASRLVGGPVGIFRITYESARYGIGKLLYFMGLISINLALLNIMPIPVLDGGHVVFALIERVKGSPVSERVQVAATYVGLALLVSLILYATWNDIWSFAGR